MKYTITAAVLALLAAQEGVNAFGINKNVQRTFSRATVPDSVTQLFAEGSQITMPALSSTMKEGKVVSWLKSEGDEIEAGEAIMVVESDKADMDVEAFEDGVLAKIIVAEGEMAPVGEAVALIAADASEVDAVISSFEGGAAAPAPAADAPAAEAAPSGGELPDVEHTEIFMPALSSTMSEGKIVDWLKQVGDFVEAGEALMVVESDKADMDVEAFEDGYVAAILKEEGEMADVGAPVGILVPNEADIASFSSATAASISTPSATATPTTTSSTGAAPAAPECEFSQIDMPALSSTMKEGKVVSWLKSEGDAISAGEAIMVVESDKADMDVEAFEDGFLAAIITGEGETGNVGAPVALIAAEESDIPALQAYAANLSGAPAPAAPAAAAAAPAAAAPKPAAAAAAAVSSGDRVTASPLAKKKAEELGIDIGSVAGTGPNGRITASDVEAAASGSAPAAAKKAAAPAKPVWTPAAGVIAATPTARALAKKAKLDLASIVGTGQLGRVTADDVKIATGEKKVERKRASPGEEVIELPAGFVPFTGMQKAVSNNMEATLPVPVFRTSREIVMDGFDGLYQKLKKDGVTVSALLAKAVALAIEKHPIINSSYSSKEGGGIEYNSDINIAMAVSIDGGLITPTLKYANERSLLELGENWKELVGKARTGSLSPDEYQSGTFTISNMGMFGVTEFGAILPPGQGGILAIGATQEHIVPCNQAVLGMKKIKKMTITLTADHRQIYGADSAMFLKTLADIMENKLDLLSK
ncbi:acetyltransferase component 5 of pyruvate dehydrogenase complex, chloroplastic [Seminavis robusta]|uniref:Dihydrolipoamide acetyltransferase component of pyruvate dehydrogenase complex n=1 Tax=Seminavis robusta TaxID=568900 RepID=A0A9N8DXX1_9STRA|nr:acetyltransferase component 5 of pyruvate dehydrogenase complex, chloroplastic [Seminavis robusta]|eukprot:Sro355_g125070.1 acetyltransferase component 5 of pyruvate dehydrogenase complex, chloroplastic (762) ;mRNA; r:31353-33728